MQRWMLNHIWDWNEHPYESNCKLNKGDKINHRLPQTIEGAAASKMDPAGLGWEVEVAARSSDLAARGTLARTLPLPPGSLAALPMPFRRPLLHLPPVPLCTLWSTPSIKKNAILEHTVLSRFKLVFLCVRRPEGVGCKQHARCTPFFSSPLRVRGLV